MKCRHRFGSAPGVDLFVQHTADGEVYDPRGGGVPVAWRCAKCGDYASLGPSDETDPRVAVEIRAAERALGHHSASAAYRWNYVDETHCNCWYDDEGPCCRCGFDGDIETECEVGYLARCIADHDSATEREGRR